MMQNVPLHEFGDEVCYLRSDGTAVDAMVIGESSRGLGYIALRYLRGDKLVYNDQASLKDVKKKETVPEGIHPKHTNACLNTCFCI